MKRSGKFRPDSPAGGNAPDVALDDLGIVDLGCIGTIGFNNAHCILCPLQEDCIRAAVEENRVFKPEYYRTRKDYEYAFRKPRRLKR